MTIRTRTRDLPISAGSAFNTLTLTTTNNSSTFLRERHRIVDEVAVGDNKSLTVSHMKLSGGIRNGTTTPTGRWIFNNFQVNSCTSVGWDHLSVGGDTNSGYASRLLAMTNPSRPIVDIPVFIFELKDIPHMLKNKGDTLPKKAADANLNWQFGWAPLISDLKKLLKFQYSVNQRVKELEALYKSGLRRTRSLDNLSGTSTVSNQIFDATAGERQWRADVTKVTQLEVWGHVKWRPTSLPPKTDAEMLKLATRAVLGLTLDLSTFWEMIPFSWLVDWCSNVGSYLAAQRNIIPASPYDLSIMRHTRTTNSLRNTVFNPGAPPSDCTIEIETKTRSPASNALSAHLHFLTLKQMSILGSLAILSGRTGRVS